MSDLDAVRAELEAVGLSEADLDPDPFVQFDRWYQVTRDAGVHQPEAMTVATVGPEGVPSTRHVLMRASEAGPSASSPTTAARRLSRSRPTRRWPAASAGS